MAPQRVNTLRFCFRAPAATAGRSEAVAQANIHCMITRKQRRELILSLVERNEIENQDQLLALLEAEGVRTTQATISRDLRDLGIAKGSNGYAVVKLEEVHA